MALSIETYALAKKYTEKKANAALAEAKEYAEDLIGADGFKIEIVDILPETNIDYHTIYFVPKLPKGYSEWIFLESKQKWEEIGDTDVSFDNYFTKNEINKMFDDIPSKLVDNKTIKVNSDNNTIYVPFDNEIFDFTDGIKIKTLPKEVSVNSTKEALESDELKETITDVVNKSLTFATEKDINDMFTPDNNNYASDDDIKDLFN